MASAEIKETSNKKKKKASHQFQFEDFISPDSNLFGSFRENIRLFLQNFAELERYTVNGMPVWCTALVSEDEGVVPLYTVEETVDDSIDKPFCNHCKLSGWGHHFVCKRRYHLIIRNNPNWNEPLERNFSEMDGHVLYGLIHCNGYGHLICINGFKRNPKILTATDAMELWNHLCTVLKVRKVSVLDDLRKGAVHLRLIHAAACGQSWFGKWGYKFSGGSSGITEQSYESSVRLLSSLSLDKILSDLKKTRNGTKIKQMVDKYRKLSIKPLVTMSELLLFVMGFESRNFSFHGSNACLFGSEKNKRPMGFDRFVDSMAKGDCRWSARRLEHVLIVIVNLLKNHKANSIDGSCGMSRFELREAARKSIGDTGLIDFVLKSIKCFEVDNHVIRRAINPSAGLVQFTIHDVFNEEKWPISKADCRWPPVKVENAAKIVVNILKEKRGNNALTPQELHEKARKHIRDSRLTDFVLKLLDNSTDGNQIVYRTKNPITKRIEFAVTESPEIPTSIDDLPGMNLSQDLLFFYENVLLAYPEKSSVSFATRVVLSSKQFVKEWPIEGEVGNQLMALTCQVLPSFDEMETELNQPLSPGEVVAVPPSITIGDLKLVVQCALRDTYCIMDEFVVRQIGGLRAVGDEKVISHGADSNGHVWVRGSGLDLDTHLRHEDGCRRSSTGNRAGGVMAWAIASAVLD